MVLLKNTKIELSKKTGTTIILIIVCLLFASAMVIYQPADLNNASASGTINENEIIQLTNDQRSNQELPALKFNQKLYNAAIAKAQHMIENNYFDHTSPSGVKYLDFIDNEDYIAYRHAENLAYGFNTSLSMVDAWMASQSHKDNILNKDYEHIGVALVNGNLLGNQVNVIVAIFGANGPIESTDNQNSADINRDRKVDIIDLSLLLSNWGASNNSSDINLDDIIDVIDLSILLSKWG